MLPWRTSSDVLIKTKVGVVAGVGVTWSGAAPLNPLQDAGGYIYLIFSFINIEYLTTTILIFSCYY